MFIETAQKRSSEILWDTNRKNDKNFCGKQKPSGRKIYESLSLKLTFSPLPGCIVFLLDVVDNYLRDSKIDTALFRGQEDEDEEEHCDCGDFDDFLRRMFCILSPKKTK
ncbi:hypothetical protein RUM43_000235 [Polyplax serrata]|uniref:Uncharacterized protein n=1 Tax=Polyplax serrata TaxID=468196 RepID=A0AAN8SGL7_POLSC